MMFNQKGWFAKLWIIAAMTSAGTLWMWGSKFAGAFSIGCATMILNFYSLFALLGKIFNSDITRASLYTGLLMLKFLALAGVIYALHLFMHIDLWAFSVGFFLIAISATCVTGSMQNHSKE